MTALCELLSTDRIQCQSVANSKKKALQILAELLEPGLVDEELSTMDVLDALIAREKLGSTGLGHAVAIPHGRIAGLSKPMMAALTLSEGVDCDSPDNMPVDLLFCLIVPKDHDDEHLSILSRIAKLVGDEQARDTLRSATSPREFLSTVKTYDKCEKTEQENDVAEDPPDSASASSG